MSKFYFSKTVLIVFFTSLYFSFYSQKATQSNFFDRKKEEQEAINRGMPSQDIEGYLFAKEKEFNAKQEWQTMIPIDPYAWSAKGGTGNTIQSAACVNASFENNNFANWTGSSGNSNNCGPVGSLSPNYNVVTPTIVSPAGPNAGLTNVANYHTVMNIPATNPNYPTCNQFGYDSIAVKVIGTNTVSEIPHVCPFYGDGKSVRMNGAVANYRACKLRYNFALTPNNRNITYAFALCIYDGGHQGYEQPYFKVSVLDQNNNPIGGLCGVYNINASMAATDTSFRNSALGTWYKYRLWRQYGVDLTSPMYSTVTAVNLEFTVGGCCQGGHWAYAYVDAECTQGGTTVGMCSGTNSAVIAAPSGYVAYQWYQLPGMTPQSPAMGGNTATLTVNPAIVGQVFQVNMITATGCTVTLIDTIQISQAQIVSVFTKSTCPGGTSGSATVNPVGSNTGYTYTWTSPSSAVVSNSNVANNLSPGIYTVAVQGISCGPPTTATVQIGTSPPNYYTQVKNYCGSLAILTASAGTGYNWYSGMTPIPSAAGQSSLAISNPVNNSVYYVSYLSPQGCRDSVRFTLSQIPGGSVFMSNIKSICPSSPPVAYAVVNLSTSQSGPYSYTVTGPSSYSNTLLNTTSKKDSVTGLSVGIYTATVFDGACFYNQTFTVSPFTYNYTVTPTAPVNLCVTGTVPMAANFGTTIPTVCGPSASGGCASPNVITIGTGNVSNTQFSWPCIYGNYYRNNRHQLLFTAADLNAAGIQPGKISSIDFFVTSKLPTGSSTSFYIGTLPGFTIKMKCTSVTSLNSTFDNVGLTTVLNSAPYTPVIGWNTHTFNTAYEWDGVSNILVDVCYSLNTAVPYTSNPIMPSTNTGVIKCRYAYSDSQPMCGTTNFATTSANRPNVRLGNCGAINPSAFTYSWSPNYALTSTNTQSTTATPSASTIYTVTVNPIGQVNCAQSQTVNVNVTIPITPTITGGTFCSNFAPTPINVTPNTGTWTPTAYMSGSGVFSPALAAVGANTVSYTIGSGTCSAASTLTINVEQYNPATLTGSVFPLCVTDATVNLMGIVANTTGTWSGTGITNNILDPATIAPGTHILNYNTNSLPTTSLCPDNSTLQIAVHTVQQPTITPAGPFCNHFTPTQLMVSPLGGYFVGLNNNATTSTGMFSPSLANIGVNSVGYTVTSGPCVKSTSIDINVEQFVPATLTGTVGPFCWNAPPVNLMNIVQNTSGTWSGSGVNSNIYSPLNSGAGTFILTYNTNSVPTVSLCPDVETIQVLVNPQPIVSVTTNSLEGCRPLTVNFDVPTVSNGTGTWLFGDGEWTSGLNAVHTFTNAGNYTVIFDYADNIGCKLVTQIGPVIVHDKPIADFYALPGYELSIADPEIQLVNTSTVLENNSYIWDLAAFMHTSSTHVNSYSFPTYGTMMVTLYATNEFGCKDTAYKIIDVKNDHAIWIPNTFTPNGDGFNDIFQPIFSPYGISEEDYEFDIFDRWGERIFSTTDIYMGWNGGKFNKGEILKEDVYVYKVRYKTTEREVRYKTGHVTLMK
jgi:gliding motility-associated-like protein